MQRFQSGLRRSAQISAAAVLASFVLIGCYVHDSAEAWFIRNRDVLTSFKPERNGFKYTVRENQLAADKSDTFRLHMAVLDSWLLDQPICRSGYEILTTSKRVIDEKTVAIIYGGRCKPQP